MQQLANMLREHGIATTTLEVAYHDRTKTIYSLLIPFQERASYWYKLRALVDSTRVWPVLAWDTHVFEDPWFRTHSESTADILAGGQALDPIAWLTRNHGGPYPDTEWLAAEVADIHQQLIEHLRSVDAYDEEEDNRDPWEDAVVGAVADPLQQYLTSSHLATGIPATQPLLLLPTTIPSHLPAILLFDPGNSGIAPEAHVSLLKRWAELYGAEPFEVSGASLAMRAIRPPGDRTTARALAWEHITYCEDIDFQMLESRAVDLYRGEAWSFWWD